MSLRKEVIGGILNVVLAGTMIDDGQGGTVAVSSTVKPASDSAAWESLGCVKDVKFDKKTASESITCFNPASGKYEEETEDVVLADYWDVTVKEHSPLVWQLLFGIKEIISGTDAVLSYEASVREVYAWAQFQAKNARDQVNRTVIDRWVKVTLKSYAGFSEKVTLPELRYQMLHSPLNGQIFMANL